MQKYLIMILWGVAFIAAGAESVSADKAVIVPFFEVYHTDNVNKATSGEVIEYGNTRLPVTSEMAPQDATVAKYGAVWANAFTARLAETDLSFSPYILGQSDSEGFSDMRSIGAVLAFALHQDQQSTLDLTFSGALIDIDQPRSDAQFFAVDVEYTHDTGAAGEWSLTMGVSRMKYHPNDGRDTNRIGIEGSYSYDWGVLSMSATASLERRQADSSAYSGTDRGVDLELSYPLGRHELYSIIGFERSTDQGARGEQPAARREDTTSLEIGYAVPLPFTSFANLAVYGRRDWSASNLSFYDSETTRFGLKGRLNF